MRTPVSQSFCVLARPTACATAARRNTGGGHRARRLRLTGSNRQQSRIPGRCSVNVCAVEVIFTGLYLASLQRAVCREHPATGREGVPPATDGARSSRFCGAPTRPGRAVRSWTPRAQRDTTLMAKRKVLQSVQEGSGAGGWEVTISIASIADAKIQSQKSSARNLQLKNMVDCEIMFPITKNTILNKNNLNSFMNPFYFKSLFYCLLMLQFSSSIFFSSYWNY